VLLDLRWQFFRVIVNQRSDNCVMIFVIGFKRVPKTRRRGSFLIPSAPSPLRRGKVTLLGRLNIDLPPSTMFPSADVGILGPCLKTQRASAGRKRPVCFVVAPQRLFRLSRFVATPRIRGISDPPRSRRVFRQGLTGFQARESCLCDVRGTMNRAGPKDFSC